MNSNQIIYTDGHSVLVTPSTLTVKDTTYKFKGITRHGLAVLKAQRLPGIVVMLVGAALSIMTYWHLLPIDEFERIPLMSSHVSASSVMLGVGIFLVVLGLVTTLFNRKRYAVRIATAEGERDVVSSSKRAYISQILTAMNRAVMYLDVPKK